MTTHIFIQTTAEDLALHALCGDAKKDDKLARVYTKSDCNKCREIYDAKIKPKRPCIRKECQHHDTFNFTKCKLHHFFDTVYRCGTFLPGEVIRGGEE